MKGASVVSIRFVLKSVIEGNILGVHYPLHTPYAKNVELKKSLLLITGGPLVS